MDAWAHRGGWVLFPFLYPRERGHAHDPEEVSQPGVELVDVGVDGQAMCTIQFNTYVLQYGFFLILTSYGRPFKLLFAPRLSIHSKVL